MRGKLSFGIAKHHGPITLSLFIFSVFLSIRWSDIPAISLPWGLEQIFIKNGTEDDISLALVTGYFSGYIIYLLTTYLPYMLKSYPIQKKSIEKLTSIYYRLIAIFLLMYKNTCDSNEWNSVIQHNPKDIRCFDDKYLERMKRFNINSDADTILLHKDGTKLPWHERIQVELESAYSDLDKLFLSRHSYLQDDIISIINKIQSSDLVQMFTGEYSTLTPSAQGKDGFRYYDFVPLHMFIQNNNIPYPMFDGDNVESLRSFMDVLIEFHSVLKKYYKNLNERYAISQLSNHNCGHLYTAIMPTPSSMGS